MCQTRLNLLAIKPPDFADTLTSHLPVHKKAGFRGRAGIFARSIHKKGGFRGWTVGKARREDRPDMVVTR